MSSTLVARVVGRCVLGVSSANAPEIAGPARSISSRLPPPLTDVAPNAHRSTKSRQPPRCKSDGTDDTSVSLNFTPFLLKARTSRSERTDRSAHLDQHLINRVGQFSRFWPTVGGRSAILAPHTKDDASRPKMESLGNQRPSTRVGSVRKVSESCFRTRAASATSSVVSFCFMAVLGAYVRAWRPTSCTRQRKRGWRGLTRARERLAPKSKKGRNTTVTEATQLMRVHPAQAHWRAPERDTCGTA